MSIPPPLCTLSLVLVQQGHGWRTCTRYTKHGSFFVLNDSFTVVLWLSRRSLFTRPSGDLTFYYFGFRGRFLDVYDYANDTVTGEHARTL